MSDVWIRTQGRAGRITLNRPSALNALTLDMVHRISASLDVWRSDDQVALVLIDAAGDRAFCAGGDIAWIHQCATSGHPDAPRRFWIEEYALNAKLARYTKPIVTLLKGFTMGGGVGIGCHNGYRIVGESSRVAMPESHIGLVPDAGGSLLLARAPGRLGEFLGASGLRMSAGDSIYTGFADNFIPEADWPELVEHLIETGLPDQIEGMARPAPSAPLSEVQTTIDAAFAERRLASALTALRDTRSHLLQGAATLFDKVSPLSANCAIELVRRAREVRSIEDALDLEFRFTARSIGQGDLIEGIRATVIDRETPPHWRHETIASVSEPEVDAMLAPLDTGGLWAEARTIQDKGSET